MKILEFNQVLIEGYKQTISLMAEAGAVTTLTGNSSENLTACLLAIMGFSNILNGSICIDGEPLAGRASLFFRKQIAYAPKGLRKLGEVITYDPPSVQDIFNLKVNQDLPISNGILSEEIRKVGVDPDNEQGQLIAVASLLEKPIMLVDNPPLESMNYFLQLASKGRIVVLASNNPGVLSASNKIVEL